MTLSITVSSVIMLTVIMLSVAFFVMLNFVKLNFVMLNVVAPVTLFRQSNPYIYYKYEIVVRHIGSTKYFDRIDTVFNI
jgi:hypothetical protein